MLLLVYHYDYPLKTQNSSSHCLFALPTLFPSCSLWCPMTCPDNLLYRPVLYCLVLTTALERHVWKRDEWRTPIKRQAYLAWMARPSESAKVDEERRLCESNSCSNGSFMYDVSKWFTWIRLGCRHVIHPLYNQHRDATSLWSPWRIRRDVYRGGKVFFPWVYNLLWPIWTLVDSTPSGRILYPFPGTHPPNASNSDDTYSKHHVMWSSQRPRAGEWQDLDYLARSITQAWFNNLVNLQIIIHNTISLFILSHHPSYPLDTARALQAFSSYSWSHVIR